MGYPYYITLITYIDIKREAVPNANSDISLFEYLKSKGLTCYPGRFQDYSDEDYEDPLHYKEDDVDKLNPFVDLRRVNRAFDEGSNTQNWTKSDVFDRDHAIITRSTWLEAHKLRNITDSGDYDEMMRELESHGINTSNVSYGWWISGDGC